MNLYDNIEFVQLTQTSNQSLIPKRVLNPKLLNTVGRLAYCYRDYIKDTVCRLSFAAN